eukprot:6178822-Pleurochrysis_carterae.AAC.1
MLHDKCKLRRQEESVRRCMHARHVSLHAPRVELSDQTPLSYILFSYAYVCRDSTKRSASTSRRMSMCVRPPCPPLSHGYVSSTNEGKGRSKRGIARTC